MKITIQTRKAASPLIARITPSGPVNLNAAPGQKPPVDDTQQTTGPETTE